MNYKGITTGNNSRIGRRGDEWYDVRDWLQIPYVVLLLYAIRLK